MIAFRANIINGTEAQKAELIMQAICDKNGLDHTGIAFDLRAYIRELAAMLDSVHGLIESEAEDIRSTEYSKDNLIKISQNLAIDCRAIIDQAP